MKIIITGEMDAGNRAADPDDSTGLTDEAFNRVFEALSALGFDDIEIQAHE